MLRTSTREDAVFERAGATYEHGGVDLEVYPGGCDEREITANRSRQEQLHSPRCRIRTCSEPGSSIRTRHAASSPMEASLMLS